MFKARASNSYTLKINYTLTLSVPLLGTLYVGGKRIGKKVVRRKSGEVICRMQNAEHDSHLLSTELTETKVFKHNSSTSIIF